MKKEEINTSLSARVRHRNAQGFTGEGTTPCWTKTTPYGNYNDEEQNHKDVDYKTANALKQKLKFKFWHWNHKHIMSKKFADNHQKL